MKLDNMFKKTRIVSRIQSHSAVRASRPEVPEGLLRKCNKCGAAIIAEDVKQGYYICPKCGGYFRVHAYRRIQMVIDEGTFEEWNQDLIGGNPVNYKGYPEKVQALQEKTGLKEAVVTGKGKINGRDTVIAVCDGRFLMASMGWAVGEKITRAVERATEEKLPVIIFACSGGARMQEGITSLMQMAKTSAALERHSKAGLLYVSVLTEPTTGGVTASFAMLGDIILAEPGALIGFAGPRVIEQTLRQKLPKGFQRAEFLVEHGFVDDIVRRENLKETLGKILEIHAVSWKTENRIRTDAAELHHADYPGSDSENLTNDKCDSDRGDSNPAGINPYLTAWDRVQISRKTDRPSGSDYIEALFTDFMEFHGDRNYGDDKAIIGGIAKFHGKPVTVIVQEKGTNTKENIAHNFGMPMPEGYRKALRLMKQAEKFQRPVICFVDTPGAFCGIEAEERGQGEAIARNLWELAGLKTLVLSIVTGEGGSGGALALAAGDQVWMLENSIYSILSPEGFASILWKDSTKAKEAAAVMKLTASDLYEKGIIEQVIPEPENLTPESMWQVAERLNDKICTFLQKYTSLSEEELLETRYARFRKF
ncbi:acetyl-CoA carboxylase carboxyltransferase subunit alpha [Blautia obeum]|uniref:acetyl-CoA carboxylase carboxyltransferase subunit alpha n=1 Tax=Blautia obeum TaxID=40520 RepID=UPI001D06CC15|nr:acetyl-CoA carboxylase carboxyltransferase subunit alpha [Blautia obeum]MCB6731754.1 acetyl-CoA carboxylase carboxyltransferase subunit alpha [Blautia obeum]MCB6958508.1 acetyl-CoA carboxylase carboxyltransferase subunit alpha [Blautia obeum]